jgi:hypothetical protein
VLSARNEYAHSYQDLRVRNYSYTTSLICAATKLLSGNIAMTCVQCAHNLHSLNQLQLVTSESLKIQSWIRMQPCSAVQYHFPNSIFARKIDCDGEKSAQALRRCRAAFST